MDAPTGVHLKPWNKRRSGQSWLLSVTELSIKKSMDRKYGSTEVQRVKSGLEQYL
jgi:hypothetical protein